MTADPSVPAAPDGVRNFAAWLAEGFTDLETPPAATDPLRWPGYPQALERARRRTGEAQAVIAGRAVIAGQPCVLIGFEFGFIAGSLGSAEGELLAAALDVAAVEQRTVVSLVASGGARMQEGMRSLVQLQRIAAGLHRLRAAAVPHICVIRHPTAGGVWASLGASADLIIGEVGASVGFAGARVRGPAAPLSLAFTSEGKWERGFFDQLVAASDLADTVSTAVSLLAPAARGPLRAAPLPDVSSARPPDTGWTQVERTRAVDRPRAQGYLDRYFSTVVPLRGDRAGGVDRGMRCGFGRHGDQTVAFVAQTGTANTAAGFRTATRTVELANRLRLPLLTLIDSPGAANDEVAEEEGVGTAIAELMLAVAGRRVPLTSVVIGAGGSGGALALGSPGELWMTVDSYFTVIAPELAAAILKRPPPAVRAVADLLRLGPEQLVELGVARGVLRPGRAAG